MWMGVSLGQPEMGENLMTEKLIRLFFNIFSFIFRIAFKLWFVVTGTSPFCAVFIAKNGLFNYLYYIDIFI